MHFDLESLKLFAVVVEQGSIAAASTRQHMVASAVSKRLSDMERDAGMPLLHRHSRGALPTPAGQALYHHTKRLLEHLRQIEGELTEYAAGVRGHARICVNLTAMVEYLPRDLHSFLLKHPGVKIDMLEQTSQLVLRAVETGAADVGICAAPVASPGLSVWPYRIDELRVIVGANHPLAGRKRIRFDELLAFDYVGMQQGASIHTLCTAAAEECGRPLKLRIQVTSFEAVRNMVGAGMGIGILPEISVTPYLKTARLRKIVLDETWAFRPLQIFARGFATLPVPSRLLIEHLTGA